MSDATSIKHIDNERVIVTEWRFTRDASDGDYAFIEVELK